MVVKRDRRTTVKRTEDLQKASKAQEALTEMLFNDRLVQLVENKASEVLSTHRDLHVHVEAPSGISDAVVPSPVHTIFDTLLRSVVCGNVALVGPTGCGKTTIAKQVADALELPFYMNGAIQSEYKLTGFVDAKGQYVRTPFREAFEKGGVYLFDEIDASNANVLLQFNAALANNHSDFPDGVIERHEKFHCIAASKSSTVSVLTLKVASISSSRPLGHPNRTRSIDSPNDSVSAKPPSLRLE